MAMIPFLTDRLNDEGFNELYICCSEVKLYRKDFAQKVAELVVQKRKRIAAENARLYRKRGNVYLNHCIGNTTMLVADRILLTEWDEWDR